MTDMGFVIFQRVLSCGIARWIYESNVLPVPPIIIRHIRDEIVSMAETPDAAKYTE